MRQAIQEGFILDVLEIESRMKQDPYRILVVADKFQMGYDEPLLHTMSVW